MTGSGRSGQLKKLLVLREEIPRPAYVLTGVSFIALILAAWACASYSGRVSPLFLPTPTAVAQEAVRQVRENILFPDMWASVYRIMVGWFFATLVAVPVGVLMGNFRFFEGLLEPFIDLVRYMPVVALVPLTILWVGIGDEQKFLILFIGTFFQEVLMISNNVKSVPINLLHIGYTLGMSRWEVLWGIVVPSSLPGIWDTFRITVGWTWTYLVVAELVAARSGLGRRIMEAQRYLATDTIIFGILMIGMLGLITDFAFKMAYGRLFPWVKER
jgi:NitT/TauT family transport system permease protein